MITESEFVAKVKKKYPYAASVLVAVHSDMLGWIYRNLIPLTK